MNHRKLEELAGDLDDFLIDVDDLTGQSDGPDDESLDKIAGALDDAPDTVDDIIDSDV